MARSQLVDDGLWESVEPLLPGIAPLGGRGAPESVTAQRSRRSCSCW